MHVIGGGHMLKLLVLVCGLLFSFHWWQTHDIAKHRHANIAQESPNGFTPVAMPDDAKDNTVLVFAPVNCPSKEAQRADALADGLTRQGIPNRRSSHFSLNFNQPTDEQQAAIKRTTAVLNGSIPAVFINGMAKSNPTLDEVVAEYRRTR